MRMNAYDTPLKEGKVTPLQWKEKKCKKPRTRANKYGMRRSDTHQMTWAQLCITTGKNPSSFWYQVNRYNMTPLEALKHRGEQYNHVVMSLKDICERVGIDYNLYLYRRRQGKSFREALLTPVNKNLSRTGPRKKTCKKAST